MQDKFSQHKAEKLLNLNLFFTLLIVYLSIFAGYLDTSIPAFVILFFFLLFTLPNNQYSILEISAISFLILYLITILVFSTDLISTLKNIKWFFGISAFLLFLKNYSVMKSINSLLISQKFFIFILSIIIVETIFINFVFHPYQVYGLEYISSILGSYNRPLGPMGNSSMTATFLVAYYAFFINFQHKNTIILLFLFSLVILLLMSSTGFVLFFIYSLVIIFNKSLKFQIKLSYVYLLMVISVTYILIFLFLELQKVSFTYYFLVFLEKINFLNNFEVSKDGRSLIEGTSLEILFGRTLSSLVPLNGGDFAWLNLMYTHGIVGFFIFIYLFYSFFNNKIKKSIIPIAILMLGAFHYGVIFNSAGQLLLAFLLIFNIKNNYKNINLR